MRKISDCKFEELLHHKGSRETPDSQKGHAACDTTTLKRRADDGWCQQPFAYRDENLVTPMFPRERKSSRRLIAQDVEKLFGYPSACAAALRQRLLVSGISESSRKRLISTVVPHWIALLLLSRLTETVAASCCGEASLNFNDMPSFQCDLLVLLSDNTAQAHAQALSVDVKPLQEACQSCPYTRDRKARGLSTSIPLEPDHSELWAAKALGNQDQIGAFRPLDKECGISAANYVLVNGLGDWLTMHEVGGGLRGVGSTRPDLGSACLYIYL
jgi:hypothetical protein